MTAADHVRRRHPMAQIDLVAEESHHLYNRMGIARLIYGRSAMQGLYLNPEKWYDEHAITPWLNTRARSIDRLKQEVALGTGEKLRYDRLILATGSSSFVPDIEGFGAPGTFVLRTADDALGLRAFAQRHGAQRAVVAGGGLLGLEAAYALHKLGLRTAVLERGDRLLRRQLDARASALLQTYLEGLGLEILTRRRDGRAGRQRPRQPGAAGRQPGARGRRVPRRGRHRAERRRWRSPPASRSTAASWSTSGCARWTTTSSPRATSPSTPAACTACGRSRSSRPRSRPTTRSAATRSTAGSIPFTMLKVVGVELTSVGRFEEQAGDQVVALEEPGGKYRKLVIEDGRIVGAILLGYSQEVAAVRTAINRGFHVAGVMDALRAGRWGALAELSGERPLLAGAPTGAA